MVDITKDAYHPFVQEARKWHLNYQQTSEEKMEK
jgi:hypothetical protein